MFQITAHGLQPVQAPIAQTQRVEKLWVVGGAAIPLQRLTLTLPGAAHVSYCKILDGNAAAHVRVTSDSVELLERMNVVQPRSSEAAIEVAFVSKLMSSVKGSLLVEVMVAHPEQLQHVQLTGSGDAVVEDGVLVTNAPASELSLCVRGSGNLFASSNSRVDVDKIELSVCGSGDLQWLAPAIVAHTSIGVKVMSSADIRMFANTIETHTTRLSVCGSGDALIDSHLFQTSNELNASVSGSGDAFVVSNDVDVRRARVSIAGSGSAIISSTDKFHIEDVRACIAGSGAIKLQSLPAGEITKLDISIAGSGLVDTADVMAIEAAVTIAGSGDVVLRARDLLKTSVAGSGDITYVNEMPREIKSKKTLRHTERGPQEPAPRKLPLLAPTRADAFQRTVNGGILPFSLNLFSSGSASAHPAPACPPVVTAVALPVVKPEPSAPVKSV